MTTRPGRAFVARADELDAAARVIVDVAAWNDDDIDVVLAAAEILHPVRLRIEQRAVRSGPGPLTARSGGRGHGAGQ